MIPDTLHALLAQRINNAAPALIDRGRPVSYRELGGESRRVAQGLRKLGVCAGDCVALWLPNLPAWLSVFFACAQLGAIAVSVNTRFRSWPWATPFRTLANMSWTKARVEAMPSRLSTA